MEAFENGFWGIIGAAFGLIALYVGLVFLLALPSILENMTHSLPCIIAADISSIGLESVICIICIVTGFYLVYTDKI